MTRKNSFQVICFPFLCKHRQLNRSAVLFPVQKLPVSVKGFFRGFCCYLAGLIDGMHLKDTLEQMKIPD